ncbi:hypothetical protein MKX01_012590 [Papaver californicum]|nr:hypothetical protein MKX01_012590 [Papaver californicum]
MKLKSYQVLIFFFIIIIISCSHLRVEAVGVNWGTSSSHPLPPAKVVELLKANKISKVKLFDANPIVLEALSGTRISVTVGIPNSMLKSLSSSKKVAQSWVHNNLTRYFSDGAGKVKIEYIAVGDEPFLQSYGQQFQPFIIDAVINIQTALVGANLANKVKVVVPCNSDAYISVTGLPSKGHFRPDLNKTMIELLTFLTHSLNDSHKTYKNLFDVSHDTLVTSLSQLGFPDMDIVIGQIGWPTDGAINSTSSTAETFMKGLITHLQSKSGTPLRPKKPPTETYIFSLLDEDQRSITNGNFKRHYGVFTFDGQAKYHIDLGQGTRNLVNAQNVEYLPTRWCVVDNNKELVNVTSKALEACSIADCSALSVGSSCFNISWPGNISYAFNSYYQQHDQHAESCDFGGLGLITTVNPSMGICRYNVEIQTSNSFSPSRLPFFCWKFVMMILLSVYLLCVSQ